MQLPRYLDPLERLQEMLFGLIMALTFTGSLSAAEAGQADVRTMLFGALGCNLAWGIIDSVFYLMNRLSELARNLRSPGKPIVAPRLERSDWLGSVGVFLWAFSTTVPVVIPFVFMHNVHRAMRVSNAIAVTLLFVAGYEYGRFSGFRPWKCGLIMVVAGSALVGMTIALGG